MQWSCLKAVSVPAFVIGGLWGSTATSGLVYKGMEMNDGLQKQNGIEERARGSEMRDKSGLVFLPKKSTCLHSMVYAHDFQLREANICTKKEPQHRPQNTFRSSLPCRDLVNFQWSAVIPSIFWDSKQHSKRFTDPPALKTKYC